jgi:hypothetical protein
MGQATIRARVAHPFEIASLPDTGDRAVGANVWSLIKRIPVRLAKGMTLGVTHDSVIRVNQSLFDFDGRDDHRRCGAGVQDRRFSVFAFTCKLEPK